MIHDQARGLIAAWLRITLYLQLTEQKFELKLVYVFFTVTDLMLRRCEVFVFFSIKVGHCIFFLIFTNTRRTQIGLFKVQVTAKHK